MSVLTNAQLATAISTSNCGNCESINDDVKGQMDAGEGIFIVPIGNGGTGIDSALEDDVVDTLVQISATDARLVNGSITTDYEIVSQNGFPN